jgi:hypothetical protein
LPRRGRSAVSEPAQAMVVCRACHQSKPASDFRRFPSGRLRARCRQCCADSEKAARRKYMNSRMLVCRRCGQRKPAGQFPDSGRRKGGLCLECLAAEREAEPARPAPVSEATERSRHRVVRIRCGRFCKLCFGLPHRVKGETCKSCGLKRGEAP